MLDELLKVENLKTYFHTASGIVKAVDGVTFTLNKGSTMGIVGESGSGKSVTANSIIRLIPEPPGKIEGGSITFDGRDILSMNSTDLRKLRGLEIASIFQDPMTSLDPVFRIDDQMVEMLREHRDISKQEAYKISINALEEVGIPAPEKRVKAFPFELSGGMCQRVIIAMALCSEPKLLIADEPTTALDVTVQAQVLELMRKLQREKGTAILLVTHNLGVIWEMCENVMVMYAGKTVEYCSTKSLYSNPMHPYTWGLLDSMPKLGGDPESNLTTIPGMPPDLRLTGRFCNFYDRCKYAIPICEQKVPELTEIEKGHFVACHRQNGLNTLIRDEVNEHA